MGAGLQGGIGSLHWVGAGARVQSVELLKISAMEYSQTRP